jgi:protein gp37
MRAHMSDRETHGRVSYEGRGEWPPRNAWLGVSAEDQTRADERIPDLLATPAAVRFVSAEPLLGPISFGNIPLGGSGHASALTGETLMFDGDYDPKATRLDGIIVGGESGAHARDNGFIENARSILGQCKDAGVPFFGKQNVKKAPLPDDLMVRELPHAR